ncbi:5-hydroxytryptamine receptor 3A-like [Acanthochromis polyacanthus]|uniref:5-hydroxytryptamine receptor 3A-like n=1 Tax=Acanthochromis polyacanthus TaxID=80966 RepID=UPI002234A4EF|nr:5-hydroxytryptamine receptor 3A-like [Acanthochromis polyacanthus]
MMLTGFFFFLPLLTGLKTSDSEQQVPDGHEDESNLQLEENPGGVNEKTLGAPQVDAAGPEVPSEFPAGVDHKSAAGSLVGLATEDLRLTLAIREAEVRSRQLEVEVMNLRIQALKLQQGQPSSGGNTSSLESEELHGNETGDEANKDYKCRFQAVLDYLNLTKDNPKYTVSRPVKNHTAATLIYIDMAIYAILDVRERDQTFVTYIWIFLEWDNEYIDWTPSEFCGLEYITAPTEYLWMPDLTIKEMTEKDKIRPSPYLKIYNRGWVEYRDDRVVVSTCKMHTYKFPFDTQTCTFAFKSVLYSDKEVQILFNKNHKALKEESIKVMRTQYEWLFVDLTSNTSLDTFYNINQTVVVYFLTMKRRSVLYVANFLLPVFFFLCLDLASLLISHRGGEKLSFKVTVLLAVTVMQLLLNDVLPTSSDTIPLIATYCIGVFGMMMLSLMETIFVMYLMEKDFQDDETDRDRSLNESREDKLDKGNFHSCFRGMKKRFHCASAKDESADETSVPKEGSSSQLTDVSLALEKVSDELGEIDRKMSLLSSSKEEEKPGYWTRMAKKIDKAYSIIYVMSASLFLVTIFTMWAT